jgi:ferredoxin hydrogenase
MKTYICDNCGFINQIEDFNQDSVCLNCKASCDKLRLIENQIAENEIDAIINSVIDNLTEEKEEKIINKKGKEEKYILIDEFNPCIKKNSEKCVNCGQCKKTCEKNANLRYDLNKCLNPICIGCGSCVLNCPSGSITVKESYKEVKEIIDKNEKIVVAIVEPNTSLFIAEKYNLDLDNIDYKLNDALKKIGFDYAFNSGFAIDVGIVEEVSEFIERLKNKQLLPLISANCPSITKYLEIYHPEVINNISTTKNPLFIESFFIKDLFCNEKGFNNEKIITVGITSCLSNKMKMKESDNNLDYVITINELIKMIELEQINMKSLALSEYENYSNYSNSAKLLDLCGGQSEIFIKSFCKLVSKTKNSVNEIDESQFMNINGIKDINIDIGNYKLRVAIVNSLYELDYLIDSGNYKKYHYIEVKLCKNGCLDGAGYKCEDIESLKEKIYKSVNNYSLDNESVKQIYKSYLSKPLSQKSVELLHEKYENKSNNLSNL